MIKLLYYVIVIDSVSYRITEKENILMTNLFEMNLHFLMQILLNYEIFSNLFRVVNNLCRPDL